MKNHDHTPNNSSLENSRAYAETRHPVEFIEPLPEESSARQQASEVLSRAFIWVASATGIRQFGLRALVVLHVVRNDLLDGATLERVGAMAGCSRQAVFKLVEDFHLSTGL